MADEVMTYTDPVCPHCQRLKSFLEERRVPYRDRDVTQDRGAQAELQRLNAPGVPVTRIGTDTIIGFDPQRLTAALNEHGLAGAQA